MGQNKGSQRTTDAGLIRDKESRMCTQLVHSKGRNVKNVYINRLWVKQRESGTQRCGVDKRQRIKNVYTVGT